MRNRRFEEATVPEGTGCRNKTSCLFAAGAAIAAAMEGTAFAAGFFLAGTGFRNDEGASAHRGAVDCFQSGFGFRVIRHFDEGKSFGPTCFAIHHDVDAADASMGSEQGVEFFLRGGVRHVTDVDVH